MTSPIEQCNALDAFLDGRLEGEDRHRFEHHLAGCDDCGEAADTWATIKQEYAGWVDRATSAGADDRKIEGGVFVESLLESMRDDGEIPRAPRGEARTRYRFAVAAAAAILLGLSSAAYFLMDKEPPAPQPVLATTPPTVSLEIPATVVTQSGTRRIAFEGGLESVIEAPTDGRVLATVGEDRVGLARVGRLRIEEATPKQTTIRLIQGRAAFDVSPRSRDAHFTVVAGEVTVIVVGTRFSVETDNQHTVTVCVEEGTVSVIGEDVRIDLEAGRSITVNEGGALPVEAVGEQEIANLTELLSEIVASAGAEETVIPVPSEDVSSNARPRATERGGRSATARKDLDAWRALIIGGEVEAAETEIRAFLRASPKDVDALMLLANCQKRQGEYRDAVDTYKRIVASGDERVASRARYLAAELSYVRLGDLRGAVALFDEYLRYAPLNTPNRADARLMQAEALLDTGSTARAKRLLQEIVEDYGRTPIANRARERLGRLRDEAEHPSRK